MARGQQESLKAGAAVTTGPAPISVCRFIKRDPTNDNACLQALANDLIEGITIDGQKYPRGLLGTAASDGIVADTAGDPVPYFGMGETCLLTAGAGGWTAGAQLVSDASGQGIPYTPGAIAQNVGAVAQSATAAAAVGLVRVVNNSITST